MTKLLDRVQIADVDFTDDCAMHVAKPGLPKTSWFTTFDQIKRFKLLTGKTIYVDATYGNDATAGANAPFFAFQTIAGAQTLATFGDTIYVRGGDYSDSNLGGGLNGVTFHFEEGATLTSISNCFNDFGGTDFNVTGHGRFFSNSASVLFVTGTSNIYFEGFYAEGGGGGSRTIWVLGAAVVVVNIKTDLVLSGLEQVLRTNNPACKVYIQCNRMIGAGGLVQAEGGTIICYAKEFIYNASGAGYIGITSNTAVLELHGSFIFNNQGLYGLPAIMITATGGLKMYGDIFCNNTDGLLNSSGVGNIDIYGKILTTGNIVISSGIVNFYDNIVGIILDAQVLHHLAGTTIIHKLLKNLEVGLTAYAALVDGAGLLLKQTASIVTSGATESINAPAATTIKTYPGAVSNTAISINITEQVSTLLIDANVDNE